MTTIRLLVRRILVGAGLLTLGSGCSLFTAEPYELVCIGKKTGSVTSTGLHSHVTPVDENIERRFWIYPEESRVMYTTNTDSWEVCNGSCKASFSGSAVKIDLDYSIGEPFYGREITQIELEAMQFRQTDQNGFDDGLAKSDGRTEASGTCSRKPISSLN